METMTYICLYIPQFEKSENTQSLGRMLCLSLPLCVCKCVRAFSSAGEIEID